MLRLLLVCAGGALGSGARYLVSTWAARALGADFPRGTLIVNATGSFVLAFVFALPGSRVSPDLYQKNFYDRALVDILVKSKGHIKSKIW